MKRRMVFLAFTVCLAASARQTELPQPPPQPPPQQLPQQIPQQIPQQPPQQPPLPPAPKQDKNCIPSNAASTLKRWHMPQSLQRALDKQRAEIERKTGIHVPSPEELQKSMKPCPAPVAQPGQQ